MKTKFFLNDTKVLAFIHVDDVCLSELTDNLDNSEVCYKVDGDQVIASFDLDEVSFDDFESILINATNNFDLADAFAAFAEENSIR